MPSTSGYPTAYDEFDVKTDGVDYVMADDINLIQDAVAKVQQALGLNPTGDYATLLARISAIEARLDALET